MPHIFRTLYCTKCFPPAIVLDPPSNARTKMIIPVSQWRKMRKRALGWVASGPTTGANWDLDRDIFDSGAHILTLVSKERKQGLSSARVSATLLFGTADTESLWFGETERSVPCVWLHEIFSVSLLFCRERQPARPQVLLPTADGPAHSHIR